MMIPRREGVATYVAVAVVIVVIVIAAAAVFLSQSKGASSSTTSSSSNAVFVATLGGSSVVPKPTGSSATGSATFTVSADGSSIQFVLTVNNLANITAAHIHFGNLTTSGPVVVPLFTGPVKNGPFTGTLVQGTITAANISLSATPTIQNMAQLITAIKDGNTYVNVHTTQFPGGEIRGQIHS